MKLRLVTVRSLFELRSRWGGQLQPSEKVPEPRITQREGIILAAGKQRKVFSDYYSISAFFCYIISSSLSCP